MRARFDYIPARDKYDNDAFGSVVGGFQNGFLRGINKIIGYGVTKETILDDGSK